VGGEGRRTSFLPTALEAVVRFSLRQPAVETSNRCGSMRPSPRSQPIQNAGSSLRARFSLGSAQPDAAETPLAARRSLLDELELSDPSWHTPPAFDDGEALLTVVRDQGLEGVVAKRATSIYRPGFRGWVKIKNRDYWRLEVRHMIGRARSRLIR
jgi:hypothetical protein